MILSMKNRKKLGTEALNEALNNDCNKVLNMFSKCIDLTMNLKKS